MPKYWPGRGPHWAHSDDHVHAEPERIAGAGLDVLEDEPPQPDCELLTMKNVVITPHHSWYSEEGGWDIRRMIIDDLKAFIDGKPPKHVVNPEVFDSPKLRMKIFKK